MSSTLCDSVRCVLTCPVSNPVLILFEYTRRLRLECVIFGTACDVKLTLSVCWDMSRGHYQQLSADPSSLTKLNQGAWCGRD